MMNKYFRLSVVSDGSHVRLFTRALCMDMSSQHLKPIVMDECELSNINNPLFPLPIDTIEAWGCC